MTWGVLFSQLFNTPGSLNPIYIQKGLAGRDAKKNSPSSKPATIQKVVTMVCNFQRHDSHTQYTHHVFLCFFARCPFGVLQLRISKKNYASAERSFCHCHDESMRLFGINSYPSPMPIRNSIPKMVVFFLKKKWKNISTWHFFFPSPSFHLFFFLTWKPTAGALGREELTSWPGKLAKEPLWVERFLTKTKIIVFFENKNMRNRIYF